MLRETSRHLAAGSVLALTGSVLVGYLVGLPSALAGSGAAPDGRGSASLDAASPALRSTPVVAGEAVVTIGATVSDAPPIQIIAAPPAAPLTLGTATVVDNPVSRGTLGIPAPLLDAYHKAADLKNAKSPSCQIDWFLLAAIGKVESDHAQGGKVDEAGNTRGVIQGPNTPYGTAKGPMQFLDSSWKMFGADGNGDGVKDVNNIYDAALGAANHLCASGKGSLQDPDHLHDAIYGYNHAEWYVKKVLDWASQYSGRAIAVPAASGSITGPAPVVTPVPTSTGSGSGGGGTTTPTDPPTSTASDTPTESPTVTPGRGLPDRKSTQPTVSPTP